MKRMIALVLALSLFAALPVMAAEAKLGYVDLQKALNTSENGKAAKERITKTVKEYESTVEARQKELRRLKEELDKQALLLSEDARGVKEREYQQKLRDFQRFTKDIQDELQQKDAEYTRKILDELLKVIRDIGGKEGYTMIFEQTEGSVLFADPKIDLTDKVIKAYDAQRSR